MLTVNPPVCAGCLRVSGGGSLVNHPPIQSCGGIGYGGGGDNLLPLIAALTELNLTLQNIDKTLQVIIETRAPLTDA